LGGGEGVVKIRYVKDFGFFTMEQLEGNDLVFWTDWREDCESLLISEAIIFSQNFFMAPGGGGRGTTVHGRRRGKICEI